MSGEVFSTLAGVNVNDHTETKKSDGAALTYLSWTFAWAEVKKRYPAAQYSIWRDDRGLPYSYDPATGYMVFTSVTIEGITHDMWLPVMNGNNKAMRAEPYEYATKYSGKKRVEAATMFDINKSIMRCLTKNLAMFGLGLYIYAGEDLPEEQEAEPAPAPAPAPQPEKKAATKKQPAAAKETPKPAPAAKDPGPICEGCGYPIESVKGKDGAEIPAEKVIQIGRERFKKTLCASCQKSLATLKGKAH